MKVFHFHNGSGGGVLSVIRNLMQYRQHDEIENHVIYTINKDQTPEYKSPGLEGASSEQVFYYSPKWNFYYTCRQLAKLLPDDQAVIVAHDWLELGMVSNLGLQNPVVQVLHGDFDYYYQLSVLHRENINKFICVSSVIEKKLNKLIAEYFDKIFYQRFPIQNFQSLPKDSSVLRCAYFVRDLNDPRKCFKLLPQIEKELQKKSVFIEWHIAGGGMDQEQFEKFWEGAYTSRINFWGELNREGVNKLLQHCNVMVLPSLAEGFPVAVVEGMKCGLIPLVSKWDGAINDLVQEGFNGFYFNYQDAVAYANCLEQLAHDPEQLSILGVNAKQKATFLFDPRQNTRAYEMHFLQVAQTRQESKVRFKSYGSRLDEPWMPNFIAKSFR